LNQGYPKHPSIVLASAQYAGLAALVRLAKRRVTRDETVQSMLDGIERMWLDVRVQLKNGSRNGRKNLSALFNAEPNMRKNYLGMHWSSTVPFGNTEFKRVYRWSEGTIGPLNELYNYAGAQLRTLGMTRFPFPKPSCYQIRKYHNGTSKKLHLSTAMKYLSRPREKTTWIAVYPGDSEHPDVRVRHPTLPELDFVDMIRAHVYELCRQCFIHSVPRDAAYRYIRLLIHLLTPFLDWKYTEGDLGRKDFWPQADCELRRIVLDLRAHYSRRAGRTPRLTQQLFEEKPEKVTVNELKSLAKRALKNSRTETMQQAVDTLEEQITKKSITNDDATSLVDDALRMSAIEGNRWHSFVSNNGYQPNSLKEVIFHGDKYQRELTDILLAYEVPVTTPKGPGVADIVVFARRVFGERVIWIPVFVVDLKTKTQLDWAYFSKRPRTEKQDTRVFTYDLRARPLSEDEWKSMVECVPAPDHELQLLEYEKGIINEFEKIVGEKEITPRSLWKGIIVLDSDSQYEHVLEPLPWLIKRALVDINKNPLDSDARTLYTLDMTNGLPQSSYMALVLLSKKGPYELLKERATLEKIDVEDPFEYRIKDDRFFSLYLTVASPGAAGESAAWSARNWHLLQYINQLTTLNSDSHIIWLDLMGCFPNEELALSRFRLSTSLNFKRSARDFFRDLCVLVKKIEFVDFSDVLKSYLFEEKRTALKQINARLKSLFKEKEARGIVIIDGWAELRRITPSSLKSLTRILERRLLDWLPRKNVEIIWIDRPLPLPTQSCKYQRSEVSPLPHDSPLREHLDMIIWNKPTPPRFLGWKSPVLEYVRLIEQDTPTNSKPFSSLLLVPHLQGWGRRFRADSSLGRNLTDRDVMELVHGPKYARGTVSASGSSFSLNDSELQEQIILDSLKLSPCILRPRSDNDESYSELVQEFSSQEFILKKQEMGKTKSSQGILDRLSFVPDGKPLQTTRWNSDESEQYFPADAITRAIIHKKKREPEEVSKWTRRPPLVEAPQEIVLGEDEFRAELRRILRTAKFLRKKARSVDLDWIEFLSRIIKICASTLKMKEGEKESITALVDAKNILSKNKESKEIWKLLVDIRKKTLDNVLLSTSSLDVQRKFLNKGCELWETFGNDLYLLILAIFWDDTIGTKKSSLETLWSAFSDWQLIHLGFAIQNQSVTHVKSKYDVSAVWNNLNWRAKRLAGTPIPIGVVESNQFGYLIQVDTMRYWLVFQSQSEPNSMYAGLFDNPDGAFRWKWYECIVDPFHLEFWSDETWSTSVPIIITHIEDKDILWTPRLDDDEILDWWAEGVLEYSLPVKGKTTPMRWFRLSRIPDSLKERLVQPEITIPKELEKTAKYTLQQLNGLSDKIRLVDCHVTVDVDNEMYQIHLFDRGTKREKPICTLSISNTTELIQTLRYPRLRGEPFKNVFWWDPESDVEYSSIKTEKGNISLTFIKPFIYRSRKGSEFLKSLILPKTAKDLLRTELGDRITLVAHPNFERMKNPFSKYLQILFLQTQLSNRMYLLQNLDLTIFEVAQFFECEQFVDTETGLRHPLKFTVNRAEKISYPSEVFNYTRIASFLEEKGIKTTEEEE
jgi:hypothetical protein